MELRRLSAATLALSALVYGGSILVRQGRAHATRPTDRTLRATRDLLGSMFIEYSRAVAVTVTGRDAKVHMDNAWRLAHASHTLLAGAKLGLAGQGCDVTPLLGV